MRPDWRNLLGGGTVLLVAGGALAAAVLLGLGLGAALLGVLPLGPAVALAVPAVFVLWAGLVLAGAAALSAALARVEAARRRRFEARPAMADEEFARLFPADAEGVAAAVRAEVGLFTGRPELCRRLLPGDAVRATCGLAGLELDDLEWVEFLARLEARFGVGLPAEADRDATAEQLVAWCARAGGNLAGRGD